jgi:hypothetical protein
MNKKSSKNMKLSLADAMGISRLHQIDRLFYSAQTPAAPFSLEALARHLRLPRNVCVFLLAKAVPSVLTLWRFAKSLSLRNLFVGEPRIIDGAGFDHPRNQRRNDD